MDNFAALCNIVCLFKRGCIKRGCMFNLMLRQFKVQTDVCPAGENISFLLPTPLIGLHQWPFYLVPFCEVIILDSNFGCFPLPSNIFFPPFVSCILYGLLFWHPCVQGEFFLACFSITGKALLNMVYPSICLRVWGRWKYWTSLNSAPLFSFGHSPNFLVLCTALKTVFFFY